MVLFIRPINKYKLDSKKVKSKYIKISTEHNRLKIRLLITFDRGNGS